MDDFEIIDPVFATYVMGNAPVERIASGCRWTEGPVWFGDARALLWSDIPNNRIMRWIEDVGTSVYRQPSNFANGHTRDREGRLVSCEHGPRRVTRTEHDGSVTVLADRYDGKRLNSPNDVVVTSDGAVWFTDPHYGIMTSYEGSRAEQEQDGCYVFRIDADGEMTAVLTNFACPNGLAFSPDESVLLVAETGAMFDAHATRHLRRFEVADDWSLTGGEVFHTVEPGAADGFRFDRSGNLWTSAGDGVHCVDPHGRLLGKVRVPETVANLCFGERDLHRLFICATTSVYSVALAVEGARRGPRKGVAWARGDRRDSTAAQVMA